MDGMMRLPEREEALAVRPASAHLAAPKGGPSRALGMKNRIACAVVVAFIGIAAFPSVAGAGGLWGALTRGSTRSIMGSALRRDLARDAASRVRRLAKPRNVFRYTTRKQAASEVRRGIAPGRHMTSRAAPGRPVSAKVAKQRYGLPQVPEVRERIALSAGRPVRANRVIGGSRGVGELTSPKRVSPDAIKSVVPLP